MLENFAELFEESLKEVETRPGSIVKGTIVAIEKDLVLVDAGLKSESAIPAEQFRNAEGELEVAVGDQVDVALDAVEDGFGETILSREKAKRYEAWLQLEKAHEDNATVIGVISGKVKGGFTVDLGGVRAFLPGSLVDVRPVRETTHLENKDLEFKVIKLDQKRNNVVVSRRAVIEKENSAEREELLENLQEGQEVQGIVKNLTDYGAFVDLGGVDGLLHITDMAWKRVKHPSEIVNVGDEITVKVLKFDRERTRVSLGLKQLGEDPWADIANRYPEGHRLTGRVANLTDYGCFVEIEEGVEGLVHVSEMDWTNKNVHPSKVVNLDDTVEVMVLEIDEERRRISLGLKQCKPNPWEEFAKNHNKGEQVTGKIKSITDFGIFIGLDGGIDGLVHLSDISWNATGEEAVRDYKKR
jgi:small subunit ribosomal protein S1